MNSERQLEIILFYLKSQLFYTLFCAFNVEEVILAEEQTSFAQRLKIIKGRFCHHFHHLYILFNCSISICINLQVKRFKQNITGIMRYSSRNSKWY